MKLTIFQWIWLLWLALAGCVSPHISELRVPHRTSCEEGASGSDSREEPDYVKHAPILWFDPAEPYYPIMPFFSAFDGQDNDHDSKTDFEDLDEITPLKPHKNDSLISWSKLHSWYVQLDKNKRKKLTTVFYDVKEVSAKKVKEIIKGDEQVWLRLEDFIKDYLTRDKSFKVFEYYFYYINDAGLKGHAEDIEQVSIFVPVESTFRILVGAGHGQRVPNNVLFYCTDDEAKAQNSGHPHVLVELGGHASAPDVDVNGSFDPSMDVNWHTENIWGTRDVTSLTGRGATSKYESWMTFKRTNEESKIYPPAGAFNRPGNNRYQLLPVSTFEKLNTLLASYERQMNQPVSARQSLRKRLVAQVDSVYELAGSLDIDSNNVDDLDLKRMV